MRRLAYVGIVLLSLTALVGCADQIQKAQEDTATGTVHEAAAKVETNISGLTVEQENIKKRLENDNKPGAMKYLYLISPMTGDVIAYSGVKGKVTSSGKRLKAKDVANSFAPEYGKEGIYLTEQMGDDGAFGSSSEYIYWWDLKGIYRQIAPGSCPVIISDQPLRVKKTALRIDGSE